MILQLFSVYRNFSLMSDLGDYNSFPEQQTQMHHFICSEHFMAEILAMSGHLRGNKITEIPQSMSHTTNEYCN